jgi:hypothetical protein
MPKKVIHSFNSGEVTPLLKGRSDFARYFNSCLTLKNYFILPTGIADFRPGTRFIHATKNSGSSQSRLIGFVFNVDIAYILEFGETYIRFYRDGAILGGPYEISSPYLAANLSKIQFTQSADVMYLVDGINRQRKLSRLGDTNWTLTEVVFKNGPFLDANIDEDHTLAPSYPAWATATAYTKNDIVTINGATINPPSYASQTIDNTAVANVGGGLVDIADTAHGYNVGEGITIAGTTNYDGDYIVQAGTTANLIRIVATFVAETPAGTETVQRKAIPVDKGGGLVGIPTDPNTFSVGDLVTLAGFTASGYNASFELHNTTSSTEIVIVAPYVAEFFTGSETIIETQFFKALT